MNTYVLIYNSFVQFEVVLAAYFMKTRSEVYTLGLQAAPAESCEGFSVNPAVTIADVDVSRIDLFIIPGGETADLVHHTGLLELIRTLHAAGKGIGAICGGVSVLRAAGILENKAYVDNESSPESPNVVAAGNIITAKANGYVDFALEIGRLMNIYKDEADLQETIDFFKYFKPV